MRRVNVGTGNVSTLAGRQGTFGTADGAGTSAQFNGPLGVALSASGSVAIVADSLNHLIRLVRVSTTGNVTTLAGTAGLSGSADGIGLSASFYRPSGVALDSAGTVAIVVSSSFCEVYGSALTASRWDS